MTPEGRISPDDLGLWSDETEEALARVLSIFAATPTFRSRSSSRMPAARPRRATLGGPQADPAGRATRLADGRARPYRSPRAIIPRSSWMRWGWPPFARRSPKRRGGRAARAGCRADPRRPRLSPAPVPLATEQPAGRHLRRQPGEPHALSAGGLRRGARGVPGQSARQRRVSGTDWPTGDGTSSRRTPSPRRSSARLYAIRVSSGGLTRPSASRWGRATRCRWPAP